MFARLPPARVGPCHPLETRKSLKSYELEPDTESSSKAIVEAYRSDGSHMVSEQLHQNAIIYGAPVSNASRRIVDVMKGKGHVIFVNQAAVYSYPVSERLIEHLKAPEACAQVPASVNVNTNPHPRTILGYHVVKKSMRVPEKNSAALTEYEYWQAPDLACYTLREVRRRIYPATGDSWETYTSDAVSVSEGEPDKELFSISRNLRAYSSDEPRLLYYSQVAEALEFFKDKPIWVVPEGSGFSVTVRPSANPSR